MIRFENLTKSFRVRGERKIVIDNQSIEFGAGRSIGLLGRNGAGKSTMLELVAGTQRPDKGRIVRGGSVSWPVSLSSSFHRELTGAQNIRFIARIYGVDTDALVAFVEDFAELGQHYYMPVRSYSQGMRARLGFGASMGIRFDTYLVDEVTAVGDVSFKRKSEAVFRERMKHAGALVVSHSLSQIRSYCEEGVVLHQGQLFHFPDVEEAIAFYQSLMQ
ncbi:ABC transporter ATP-binding protein [Rhodosalinus sp.]|uniref:ABC transporter ATP-binding protein n=1 Tax=Rhodosalinus sp. TaxID=2047741 RepID=UPI003978F2E1